MQTPRRKILCPTGIEIGIDWRLFFTHYISSHPKFQIISNVLIFHLLTALFNFHHQWVCCDSCVLQDRFWNPLQNLKGSEVELQ